MQVNLWLMIRARGGALPQNTLYRYPKCAVLFYDHDHVDALFPDEEFEENACMPGKNIFFNLRTLRKMTSNFDERCVPFYFSPAH